MEGARDVEAGFSGHTGRVGEISLLLSMRSPSGAVDWVLRTVTTLALYFTLLPDVLPGVGHCTT
jgi:hypothetical protein